MKRLFTVVLLVLVGACGGSGETDADPTGIKFTTAADFDSSAAANLIFTTTGTCSSRTDTTMDAPDLADGLDCDADGGIVAHVTPSAYKLAIKRLSLAPADDTSTQIDFIADTGTLADSQVVEFSTTDTSENIVTIEPGDLQAGSYSGIEYELYYFEMTFPVGGVERNVRIYMSDDDFDSEGGLGHHQGDITFIADDGTEDGWVDFTWTDTATTRSEAQNGAGGTDAETSHDRGFFGNAEFWNSTDLVQGAGQDIFIGQATFPVDLDIPDPTTIDALTTITMTFSVADTFYYEDFAPIDTGFYPDSGGEATSEGAEWAPLTPVVELSVSE